MTYSYSAPHGKNMLTIYLWYLRGWKRQTLKLNYISVNFQAKPTLSRTCNIRWGYQTTPWEGIKAIQVLTPPTTVDEVHHLLGLTGYYHKFISLYADITKPLNNLLHKKTPFAWLEECQYFFKQLMKALCNPPIWQHPDPAKPYMLFCDASNYAFTGVLTQAYKDSEDLRPITYTSSSFSPVQQH